MPTLIGHAAAGIALSSMVTSGRHWLRAGMLSVFCALAPDLDAIGFGLGIPYQHWLGHRGFTHGIMFAAIAAMIACVFILGIETSTKIRFLYFCVFFASGLSHGVLDAVTNGGLGVAFFSPFSGKRFFLPWQPIEVSPLSLKRFLTPRGIDVIKSEFCWIILPALCFMTVMVLNRIRQRKKKGQ